MPEQITSFFVYFAVVAVNLITFSAGGCWSWTSPILPKLSSNDSDINPLPRPTTTLEDSWIAAIMNLGALVGPLAGGVCSEKFGKKNTLLIFGLPLILSHTLSAFAINVHFFLVARFLIGVAAGTVFAVLPGYVGDIVEDKNRGLLGSMLGVFNSCGILFMYTVGPFLSVQAFSLINLIAPVAFYFIFGLFVPGSPFDLIKQGRKAEAEVSLMKLRGKRTSGEIQKELTNITNTIQTCSGAENTGFTALFKNKALTRAMLISNGLMVFQQLSGICAVIGYMQTIFEMTENSMPSTYSTIFIGFVQLFSNLVSAHLIEKTGRKLLLIISCAFSTFSLIALGGYFLMLSSGVDMSDIGWLPIASLIIFIVAFNLGLANLPWVILAELFPSNIRAVSSTFTTFFSFALSFLVTICFPFVNEALGMTATLWIFAGVLLIGFVFCILVVPETKGKSTQEIQNMLEGIQK
ncbi:facilitated trehalose transporter Tret1-like [Euwallacea similis]|uniref:facilitated trehalose transporter Tret1-like n=1 Tax=Euwallacea similis TaxID=1736056 RepID=UPI00344B28DC